MAVNNDHIEETLQSCLDRIWNEQENLDSVLKSYPDLVDVLRPELETAVWLKSLAGQLDPRPGFVHASRCRVIDQIKAEALTAQQPVPRLAWLWGWFEALRQKRLAFQFILAVILIISLFLGSSGVALASQGSIPGDTLYPLKISTENAALSLTPQPQGSARLHVEFTQRRLIEIQSLELIQRYALIPETVNNYNLQVGQAIQALSRLAAQEPILASGLAHSMKVILAVETQEIIDLGRNAPQETLREIARVSDISQNGLLAIESLASSLPVGTSTPTLTITPTPFGPAVLEQIFSATPTPTLEPTGTFTPTPTPTPTPSSIPPFPTDTPVVTVAGGSGGSGGYLPAVTATSFFLPPTPTVAPFMPTLTFTPVPTWTPEPPTPIPATTVSPTKPPPPTSTTQPPPSSTPEPTKDRKPTHTPKPTQTGTPDTAITITPHPTRVDDLPQY